MKYITLLLVLSLCFLAMGQDGSGSDGSGSEAPESEVSKFMTEFDKFEGKTDSKWTTDNGQVLKDLKTSLNNLKNEYNDQEIADMYKNKSNDFFDQAEQTFKAGSGHYENLQADYENDMSGFIKGYMADMTKGGDPGFEWKVYEDDLKNLNDNYADWLKQQKDATKALGEDTGKKGFNPIEYLDKASEETGVGAMRMQWNWEGVGNTFGGGGTIKDKFNQMGNYFTSYFGGSESKLGKEVSWLNESWQNYETAVMGGAKDNDIYKTANKDTNYTVNQYGNLIPAEDEHLYADDLNVQNTYTVTKSFNNRSYGYAYSNGTKQCGEITMGGNKYVLKHHVYTSPIVLDMDGNGKIEASAGKWLPHKYENGRIVEFDINGDGFGDLVEWVGPNDGLLMVYKEGKEVNGMDLFGEAGGWVHGYEKLQVYDTDTNKVLEGEELAQLSVWQDKNGNAKVDSGEVTSVKELGITSISIDHDKNMVASFVQNDTTKTVWDWYPCVFDVKKTK
jgi:hypothetical protein